MAKGELQKREVVQKVGFCKYCGQIVMVEAPEELPPEELNELASQQCNCDEAKRQQRRIARMGAAAIWAENYFSRESGQLQAVCCAIKAVFEYAFDNITIKSGKKTYKIDMDKDGMIRIRTKYTDNEIETF